MCGQETNGLRVVFFGAGELACPALRRIASHAGSVLAAVVTQPDRPRGRRPKPAPCPAMSVAADFPAPVLTPVRVGDPEVGERLAALSPDLFVVVDYGQFLPQRLLAVPRLGAINLHPSLLPRYRGAAPIQWAVANGDRETGVSILFVTARMDAGDILLQERMPIADDDTAVTLAPRLAERGAALLDRALDLFARGPVAGRPQEETAVTPAPKLTKEDGWVDWRLPAEVVRNRVRGFQPWPGCCTEAPAGSGRRLRLVDVRAEPGTGQPGVLLPPDGDAPRVGTGEGLLRLQVVQPEGRRPMSGGDWMRGYVRESGLRLGGNAG